MQSNRVPRASSRILRLCQPDNGNYPPQVSARLLRRTRRSILKSQIRAISPIRRRSPRVARAKRWTLRELSEAAASSDLLLMLCSLSLLFSSSSPLAAAVRSVFPEGGRDVSFAQRELLAPLFGCSQLLARRDQPLLKEILPRIRARAFFKGREPDVPGPGIRLFGTMPPRTGDLNRWAL